MNDVLKKSLQVGAGPAGLFATAVGFFCDFVKPYINLVPYFLVISALGTIGLWFFWLRHHIKGEFDIEKLFVSRIGYVFACAVLSTVFWLIMLPIFAVTPKQGLAASEVPAISDWQEKLFGKLDKIDNKLDIVIEKINALDTSKGGIISKPSSATEWYHNARIHELGGNLLEARKAYDKYFESDLAYLDPFLSYHLILKNVEGPSSARELMQKLRDAHANNPSAALAYILTKEEKTDRISLLENLTKQFPEYGPGFVYLAKQFSYVEAGIPTNQERQNEHAAITKATELEKTEKVSKFFIDKKQSEELLSWMKAEHKIMEGAYGDLINAGIKVNVTTNNKISTITFTPSELVKKIFYRINKQGDFKDTGTSIVGMPGSNEPLPNYYIMEALPVGEHTIEAKYLDQKGGESKITEQKIQIKALSITTPPLRMIDPKTNETQYMVLWSPFEEKEYIYTYSIDNQNLDQKPPDYLSGTYLKGLAPGKHTLYVQGTLGTEKTNIEQFEFQIP